MAVLSAPSQPQGPQDQDPGGQSNHLHGNSLLVAAVLYAVVLVAFWFVARYFSVDQRIGGHMLSGFLSFALLLAPYWFFGFGAADVLKRTLTGSAIRALAPGLLAVPYLVFSIPRGEFLWAYAVVLFAIPVGLAALFEYLPPGTPKLCWQDALALLAIGLPVEFRWLAGSFPHPGLSALPKFLLLDAALYAFLVVRGIEGVGYDFRARWRDLVVGMREWASFAPIAIGLGWAMSFILFHCIMPSASHIVSALLVTFFFVAIPEEFFFRGLLQNMLEARLGRSRSLIVASLIFGLSHFNKPLPFNWRYVLLAAIAGIFYGRAWRDRRRVFASGITHTLVDVVWGLWFKVA
ncbi:MAG TPA: type II CAAX endopeptidase family protein [Candidatus Angelobacter sp.]|nr:type II CAAX endopeptidase family protein [Candidatus Angelobacter sp.]